MKQRDLIKKLEDGALFLNDMEVIMMFMQEEQRKKKYQDIKRLMND